MTDLESAAARYKRACEAFDAATEEVHRKYAESKAADAACQRARQEHDAALDGLLLAAKEAES